VTLRVHALEPGATRTVVVSGPDGAHATFRVSREDDTITATTDGAGSSWALELTGVTVDQVDGGDLRTSELGSLVDVPRVELHLADPTT
jgi:hypothetical protein